MSKIIKFPSTSAGADLPSPKQTATTAQKKFGLRTIVTFFLRAAWIITTLLWPLLRWILSANLVFQFGRMLYYWDTRGVHSGWTFTLHFAVFTALTCFIAMYDPKLKRK